MDQSQAQVATGNLIRFGFGPFPDICTILKTPASSVSDANSIFLKFTYTYR